MWLLHLKRYSLTEKYVKGHGFFIARENNYYVFQTDTLLYLEGLKASVAVLFSLAAIAIYWRVRSKGEAAMTSFQLNEDEVKKDYKIIFAANIFLLLAMVLQVMAGLEMIPMLIPGFMRMIYILTIAFVLIRWVNLFR